MIAILSLLCLTIFGVFLTARILEVPLPFISTPTVAPLVGFEEPATFSTATPLDNQAQGTPTPAGPTPTSTPTPALVVARTLPSLTYMGKDIEQTWQIFVMNADGSAPTAISPNGLDDTTPVWSPDGRKIALVSRRDGNREIYVMDVESSDVVNITRHPADDWTPAWSPDGSQLLFHRYGMDAGRFLS